MIRTYEDWLRWWENCGKEAFEYWDNLTPEQRRMILEDEEYSDNEFTKTMLREAGL